MTLNPKLVIFDLDGVLVNSEHFYMSTMSKALIALGFTKYTLEYCIKHTAGLAIPRIIQKIEQEEGRTIDEADLYNSLQQQYVNFEDCISIVSGAKEFIQRLQVPFCVASSSDVNQIRRTLAALDLTQYFGEHVFSCATLNRYKPDPAIYIDALRQMGFTADQAVAIEDSVPGVTAARGAGVPTIGFVGANYLQSHKEEHAQKLLEIGAFTIQDNYTSIYNLLFGE